MPTTYVTNAQLKSRIAGKLHKDAGRLEHRWDEIISDANTSAANTIRAKLINRGYTVAQIASWERVQEFNLAIGMYRALVFGATADDTDDTWPEKLKEWLDELETDPIVINDGATPPEGDSSSSISSGKLATDDDIFVLDPEGRGEVTEW